MGNMLTLFKEKLYLGMSKMFETTFIEVPRLFL